MAEWIETYRGVVSAWECDIVEHFTIAYYFDRFADATRNFLELIGEGETLYPAAGTGTWRLYTSFTQELRAGAGFHMLSAVTHVGESSLQLGRSPRPRGRRKARSRPAIASSRGRSARAGPWRLLPTSIASPERACSSSPRSA